MTLLMLEKCLYQAVHLKGRTKSQVAQLAAEIAGRIPGAGNGSKMFQTTHKLLV